MDTNTATVVTAIATSVSHSRSYYGNYSGLSDPDIFGSGQGQCISRQNSPYYFQRSEMSEKQKQTRTIRLFLSYASEQKALVTQVCEILTEQFELWFDKDNLTGGVSLFDEISDGLGWCDYGVVFLSKDYLAKGWTNAEFSGLWTKQIAKRSKVITPDLVRCNRRGGLPVFTNGGQFDRNFFSRRGPDRGMDSQSSGCRRTIQRSLRPA